jgi:hypothetical protein
MTYMREGSEFEALRTANRCLRGELLGVPMAFERNSF